MKLISWNIQWCRGMDGSVDPARIAREAKAICDPDVCCFQEVAVNYPDLGAAHDQPALLAAAFPGYSAHFAIAVDAPDGKGARKQFGNLILSRLPVRQVFRHTLPWPPESGVPNMPRVALEAVVEAAWGLVSVVTTHLEFFSARQRAAQAEHLCALAAAMRAHAAAPAAPKPKDSGPFTPFARPASSILAGDFNMQPDDPSARRLREVWKDAWSLAHPGEPHAPTFCVFDRTFSDKAYCCDFVLVSPELAPRVASVRVDPETQASDHQPVIVEFSR
ncbi:MAG: endonuclease/exonuclease/phosphatase family protein [Burkholderiales bacterium]|nr:endonuclease/exonuclease/phosphatase family protein [Burkholderiales bacterium]